MKKILPTFKATESLELALLGAGAFAMWWWFHTIDAFDSLVTFMQTHESWELDEIFSAVVLAGICGFIYAARRHSAARKELKRRNEAESNVTWLAQNDSLTRLPNRRFFEDFARRVDDQPTGPEKAYVVFAIDLDGFKKLKTCTATPPATKCCAPLRNVSRNFFRTIWWHASAATSSSW